MQILQDFAIRLEANIMKRKTTRHEVFCRDKQTQAEVFCTPRLTARLTASFVLLYLPANLLNLNPFSNFGSNV